MGRPPGKITSGIVMIYVHCTCSNIKKVFVIDIGIIVILVD
jgi:hypothetical protein